MSATKSNMNIKIGIVMKEQEIYGEQLLDIIKRKGIPRKTVEVNDEGHIIADKDKDPELYDWAVNG